MGMLKITNHARLRLHERVDKTNIEQKDFDLFVRKARMDGVKVEHFYGTFHSYLTRVFYKSNKSTLIKVYRNYVFIFKGNKRKCRTLITVIPIIDEYKNKYIQYIRSDVEYLYEKEITYFREKVNINNENTADEVLQYNATEGNLD